MLRVLFIHGLEGSPQGRKAQLFASHFQALTPAMDTRDFEGCVAQQAAAIAAFDPDVVVGSSFGGAVAWALLDRGLWAGPTLMLASAARKYVPDARLPPGIPVVLVHATADDIVPVEDSQALARTGTAASTRLYETEDDHGLGAATVDGSLLRYVEEVIALPKESA